MEGKKGQGKKKVLGDEPSSIERRMQSGCGQTEGVGEGQDGRCVVTDTVEQDRVVAVMAVMARLVMSVSGLDAVGEVGATVPEQKTERGAKGSHGDGIEALSPRTPAAIYSHSHIPRIRCR